MGNLGVATGCLVISLTVTACETLVTVYACTEGTVSFYDSDSTLIATRKPSESADCRAQVALSDGGRVEYSNTETWESSSGMPGCRFTDHLTIDAVQPGDFLDLDDQEFDPVSRLGQDFGCNLREPELMSGPTGPVWDDPMADQVDARVSLYERFNLPPCESLTVIRVDGSTSTAWNGSQPWPSRVILIDCPTADYDDIREVVARGMRGLWTH